MNVTDNITFKRIERECGANENARKEGWSLIYDFQVLIDGEYRASLHRNVCGRGYEIYDADGRPIHKAGEYNHFPKHLGSKVEKQADFFQFASDLLESGRIPTLAEMAALRDQEAAQKISDDKTARQTIRDRFASAKGPALLEILKLALPILEGANAKCTNDTAFIKRVRDVIADAERVGDNFEDMVESELWSMRR